MLLVVGAGFAGLAASLSARQLGWSVTVLAGATRTASFAECLQNPGIRLLHGFGVDVGALNLPMVRRRISRWGTSPLEDRVFPSGVPSPLILGKQAVLDEMHRIARRTGVQFIETVQIQSVVESEGAVQAACVGPTGDVQVTASYLIDASGRAAVIARRLRTGRRTFDHLVAYGIRGQACRTAVGAVFTLSVADGWIYAAFPTANDAQVLFFTNGRRSTKPTAESIVERLPSELREMLTCEEQWRSSRVVAASASTSILDVPGGLHWLACGDALQTVDPLSSSGMTTALQQGSAAAIAAHALLAGDPAPLKAYWTESQATFLHHVRARNAYYGHGDASNCSSLEAAGSDSRSARASAGGEDG